MRKIFLIGLLTWMMGISGGGNGTEMQAKAPALDGPKGSGGPGMQCSVQFLSDTQGVDFTSYIITRLLATLKRNWYAVMPESANKGDKGVVYTTFQISPDGSVPAPDPVLERTSGKDPLDNAALAAIRASNPFKPLPSQFHGPSLKLRIAFVYNIPIDRVPLR